MTSIRPYLKTVGIGFMGALLAIALALVGFHLYIDHANLHAIVNMVQQAQQHPAAPPSK